MKYIDIDKYNLLIGILERELQEAGHQFIYGVPKNGSIIAATLAERGFTIVDKPEQADAIVDDLIDSGATRKRYAGKPFFTLVAKVDNEWISFWFEKPFEDDKTDIIRRQLEMIGEDPKREGLIDTPRRVEKMWKEIYIGYDKSKKPLITIFDNGQDGIVYDEMIIDEGEYYSQCEHHMVPFFGKYYFAYIPDKKILGLSKVARIVDYYSAKLQIQERLVKEILDEIERVVKPKGIAMVMKGEHLCKTMRGVRKKGVMTTNDMRGAFKENPMARSEFLKFVNGH